MSYPSKNPPDPETIIARMNGGKSEVRISEGSDRLCAGRCRGLRLLPPLRPREDDGDIRRRKGGRGRDTAPGSFCGEECLTGHALRLSTLKTLSETELVRMAKASTVSALRDDRQFSELFTTYLMERNIRVQEDLVDQLLNSTEKRLARLLLILANYGKEERPDPIVPKINQETLAEMIGTTRTHVNFFMNKFRQLGLIEYNGDIKVHRSLLNMLLHEKPEIAPRD